MSKRADGPTSRRMGFGFKQHKGAGVPYTGHRPLGEIKAERIIRHVKEERHQERLSRILLNNPDAKLLAEEWAKAGWTPEQIIRRLES